MSEATITYDIYPIDNVAYVKSCANDGDTATILSTYEGLSVTYIGGNAFSGCDALTNVIIPDTIRDIQNNAFISCSNLTGVYIANIAKWCEITFGNNASNPLVYAHNLYLNNVLVTNLVVPNGTTSIASRAFVSCTSLTSVSIPNSVTSIGDDAFRECGNLTSIAIGSGVTSIGDYTFWDCYALTSINVDSSNTAFLGSGNCLIKLSTGKLMVGSNNSVIPIDDSVSIIGSAAFKNRTGLTNVTIPSSVRTIEDWAFYGCTGITKVTILYGTTQINTLAFASCTSLSNVTLYKSITTIQPNSFTGSTNIQNVYFYGKQSDWNSISTGQGNDPLTSATLHLLDYANTGYLYKNGDKFLPRTHKDLVIGLSIPTKTSNLTNDGDGTDSNSPFATQAYVAVNGGKIDEIQINGTTQTIVNKVVNLPPYPTKQSLDIDDLEAAVSAIESKIPTQATSSNQLADKDFVNSSIATNTAYFKGTLDATTDLGLTKPASTADVVTALNSHTFTPAVTNNDYCVVINKDSNNNTLYQRYKYNANAPATWGFEYAINNSSFTANQWNAINSGITSSGVAQISTNASDISDILDGTQSVGMADMASGYSTGGSIDTALQSKANDTAVVHLAGAETITGAKTFSSANVTVKNTSGGDCSLKLNRNTNTEWEIKNSGGNLYFNAAGTTIFKMFENSQGSYISNGTYNYTMPGATGTLALTSQIPTYNFNGTTFYSGNSDTAEHNCNNAVKNGNYYYSSSGPATSLGASTTDGALYVQSYSDAWVGQIAQDYRNGRLFVRGKKNGEWQSWVRVANYNEIPDISGKADDTAVVHKAGAETITGAKTFQNPVVVEIPADSSGELKATRTVSGTTRSVWVGIGSGNVNRGLYDDKLNKWMVYSDDSGTYLNGNAATATTATSAGSATTCSYPLGFSSRSTNATWGNQTGATVTSWNESAGGSIDFRKDNPSSGKLSVKVDGRFYGNEGANPTMLMATDGTYWGMGTPDAETGSNKYIRTTSAGIIPYQSGGAGSGHSTLGTSSWFFATAYVDKYYVSSSAVIQYNSSTGCVEIVC